MNHDEHAGHGDSGGHSGHGGHSDHVGIAEGVRIDAQVPVLVPAGDAEMARTGKAHKREGNMLTDLWHPAAWKFFAMPGS